MAKRETRLILNLVDLENPAYIAKEIKDKVLRFIGQNLEEAGRKVLVHCNQGMSRSPGIGCKGERWNTPITAEYIKKL